MLAGWAADWAAATEAAAAEATEAALTAAGGELVFKVIPPIAKLRLSSGRKLPWNLFC